MGLQKGVKKVKEGKNRRGKVSNAQEKGAKVKEREERRTGRSLNNTRMGL